MTDAEILATLSDRDAFVATMFGETRGEPIEGKVAFGAVVLNRVAHPQRYANTIKGVCLESAHGVFQFTCWSKPDTPANYAATIASAERLISGVLGSDADGRSLAECGYLADGLMKGILRSNVAGATNYLTRALYESPQRPSWAQGAVIVRGSQVFLTAI